MFFASSNGKERLEEEVEEAMMTTSTTGDANEAGRSAARDERGEKDYDDDDDESLKDTTTKILAETKEEETGSTGNRHNNTASTKKRSKRGPSGCTPNRVREFTAEALKNPKGGDTSETTSKVWLDAFGEDVSKRYNFTTCAVVGNSGSLLRPPRLNNDIDEHEVVIRLNAAPTSGRYGQRVGRKTTLRFLNAARAKTYLVGGCSKTMPCDEGSTLVATRGMPFAPSKVITNAHLSIVRGRRLDFGEEDFEDEENMQIIQNGIKAGVYRKSNEQFIIANQNTDTLHIIMRSIFLQHATNISINITDQIRQLNTLVIEDAVPRVYSSLIAHNKYLRDVNTLPQPLDLPTLPYESKQLPRLNYGFSKEGDKRENK